MTAPRGAFPSLNERGRRQFIGVATIRQIIERVIQRLKQWGVLAKKKWTLDFEFHRLCATAAAKLTQIQLYTNPLN
jgi:hypothetical protein